MLKIVLSALMSTMIIGLGACGKVLDKKMDDSAFSNGVAGASYFYNDKFVHEESYGKVLDGKLRKGIVNCAFSKKHNKFSLDMYVPEESDIASFAHASEGVFIEIYDRGLPDQENVTIVGNAKSKVNAMLPATIVQQVHHFSTATGAASCDVKFKRINDSYKGTVDCNNLTSAAVAGRLTVRADFECQSIANY